MGARGPVGKRDAEKMGHRTKAEKEHTTKASTSGEVKPPPTKGSWHPIAKRWYKSLRDSAQAQFFEPSDWAAAYYVAEAMSLNLEAKRFSSELFKGIWAAMGELLTTEGARRRVRVEVERAQEQPQGVTSIDEYKRRLAEGD